LTVHIIANTHDDVGWGKTVEEYFTGGHGDFVHASVDAILTSVIKELALDPKKRFTYVEMKFFSVWYNLQSQMNKDLVKKLIKNGQLEITQGGWTATDEACPNYEDMILNMHIGHQFLWNEFGVRPRVGWMLDSFGHSESNAYLFADFGFEALFFTRINNDTRTDFLNQKKLHFLWTPFSKNFNAQDKQILTHVYHRNYGWLPGLDYEERSNEEDPLITNRKFLDYNEDLKCANIINVVQELADK